MVLCLSVTSWSSVGKAEHMELVLRMGASLSSTYHTLCYREIWVSPKIMVLPSGTLSQTLVFENSFGVSIVETCYRISSRKVDAQSVVN